MDHTPDMYASGAQLIAHQQLRIHGDRRTWIIVRDLAQDDLHRAYLAPGHSMIAADPRGLHGLIEVRIGDELDLSGVRFRVELRQRVGGRTGLDMEPALLAVEQLAAADA